MDDANALDQGNELTRSNDLEGAYSQNEGLSRSPWTHGLVYKQRLPSASPQLNQGKFYGVIPIPLYQFMCLFNFSSIL